MPPRVAAPAGSRFSQLRITRGALILAGLELGLSLIYMLGDDGVKASMAHWLAATPDGVWHHGRVWTLVTGVFVEPKFLGLILHVVMLWSFVPTLERFWGEARFFRFVAITSLAGTIVGTAVGLALGPLDAFHDIGGLDPFIYAAIVAFGIIYAKQPVQFFGVLPLTGRQMMFGFLGFLALFQLFQQQWADAAAFVAAIAAAFALTAKRGPLTMWNRWRLKRRRAQLSVLPGGKKRDEQTWLN